MIYSIDVFSSYRPAVVLTSEHLLGYDHYIMFYIWFTPATLHASSLWLQDKEPVSSWHSINKYIGRLPTTSFLYTTLTTPGRNNEYQNITLKQKLKWCFKYHLNFRTLFSRPQRSKNREHINSAVSQNNVYDPLTYSLYCSLWVPVFLEMSHLIVPLWFKVCFIANEVALQLVVTLTSYCWYYHEAHNKMWDIEPDISSCRLTMSGSDVSGFILHIKHHGLESFMHIRT